MHGKIDLHIHSTASDGIHRPDELVQMASTAGLSAIAIADHDSVASVEAALAAAETCGITVIPAVELSVSYEKYHDVHLLGYWIDHRDPDFKAMLAHFCTRRESRGLRVIDKINEKLQAENRVPIDPHEVMALAEGALGRPHIARVLMQKGYANTMQDAFNNYLVPCNLPKEYIPFDDAIKEIKRIGGVAVLAHPQSISRDRDELLRILTDMRVRGLDGVEALNTMGYEGDDQFLSKIAKSLDLAISGGSDFHGGDDDLKMGCGRGKLAVSAGLLAPLEDKRPKK